MVTRKRVRSILTALGLYVVAALLIGYFGVNAFSGNRGLKAKQDIDQQMAELSTSSRGSKLSAANGNGASLCSSRTGSIPICSTSAPALLDYSHPHDLTMMLAEPPHRGP
jgi:hypothetical protein